MGDVLRARERVRRRIGPLRGGAGERERSRLVRERRDARVGREHDPVVGGLEPVLVDEACEQRVVLEAAQEAGRADHLAALR